MVQLLLTHLSGWAGHWRGENATDETVICDLSYETRRWLISMCSEGYTVAEGATNTFWASDLLHRLYHMPAIGYGYIEHFIESYEDALAFAKNGTTTNTHDSDVLQYFALDAYAYDIALPGVGCAGDSPSDTASHESEPTSSATPTSPEPESATSAAPAVSRVTRSAKLNHANIPDRNVTPMPTVPSTARRRSG